MIYQVVEIHAVYEEIELKALAVLWKANEDGSVRSSYSTTKVVCGYFSLKRYQCINEELIQKVAGHGMELPDDLKAKYFPGKRKWER